MYDGPGTDQMTRVAVLAFCLLTKPCGGILQLPLPHLAPALPLVSTLGLLLSPFKWLSHCFQSMVETLDASVLFQGFNLLFPYIHYHRFHI